MIAKQVQNQRTRQRQATRRLLLEAGLQVVAANGFAGASTAAIAKATGKAHGTVFVHFPTRDALVAELVAEVGRSISSRLATLDTLAPTLAEVLTAHLQALADNEVLYARMLGEATVLPMSARAQIFALQSGIAWRLRAGYLRSCESGGLRKIDPMMLSNLWISLTNHYLLNRDLFAPSASVIASHGDQMKAHFLQILAP